VPYPGAVPYPPSPGPGPYPGAVPYPGAGPYTAPSGTWKAPARVEPVPGTPFAVGYLSVPVTTSGMAIGSLVAGVASLLVLVLVTLVGLSGASAGWGAWVAGAFAVPSTLLGVAGAGLGAVSLRQIRTGRAPIGRRTGRWLAISGIGCGAAGAGCTVLVFVLVLALTAG
jgi:hypothetical protein